MHIWIWNWVGDGYNWTKAASKEEALDNAKKISSSLVVDEKTLRIGTMEDVKALDRRYASMFY